MILIPNFDSYFDPHSWTCRWKWLADRAGMTVDTVVCNHRCWAKSMLRISTYLDWHKTGIIMGTDDFFNSIGTKFWPAVNSAPYLFKMQAESQVLDMVQRNSGLPDDFPEDMGKHSKRFTGWLCVCAWGSWVKRTSQRHIEQGVIKPCQIMPRHIQLSQEPFLLWLWLKTTLKWTHRTDHFPCAWVALTRQPPMMCGRTGELQDTARQQLNVKICKDQMQYVTTWVTTCNNSKTMPIMTCRVSNTRRNSMFTWTWNCGCTIRINSHQISAQDIEKYFEERQYLNEFHGVRRHIVFWQNLMPW